MAIHQASTGISAMFTPDEIECLVRTAGEAVCGDRGMLSSRQLELAQRVYDLIHGEDDQPKDERALRLLALAEEMNVRNLDDVVLDLVSRTGSDVNNGGLGEQISFLLYELGEADTDREIRAAAQP